ncbi:acyltransferase family protein [Chryseobacterium sp. SL1]|uniref:acyltransferase family protein n=1 Tax=Chryseobacterium sp. SL1 TaxID=2995159 RepID=UPI002276F057|nr:acyltransferase [Chryseobacterium sp. SL1]MCY1662997.1 acyltransferase [Chryseobacterium sp. SL1]
MKRILGLDILRAIAILLVVFMHSGHFLMPLFNVPIIGILLRRFVGTMNFLGELGVELFFILSGFLIGGILIKTFERTDYNFSEIKNFWVRRWFRTLPNYLLFLILNILFFVIIMKENIFYPEYFLFLQNFTEKIFPFFKESWSLAIEEWFYLTLPICLLVFRSLLKKQPVQKMLLISFTVYFLLFFIIKIIAVFNYNIQETRGVVIYRLDTMVIGVFMSYFYKYHKALLYRNRKTLFFSGLLLFAVLFIVFMVSLLPEFNLKDNYWVEKFYKILILDLFGISFALLIPLSLSVNTTKNRFLDRTVTTISLISYSLYLVHFSILDVLIFSRFPNETEFSSVVIYVSYLAVAFGLSYIVYKYFEIPMTKLRDKISMKE